MTCKVLIYFILILTMSSKTKKAAGTKMVNVAKFDELYEATKNNNILIIDVRESQELQQTGEIPNSINIPLGNVKSVLSKTSPEDFQARYGKEKPTFTTPIIFTCRSGRRSEQAYLIAEELGFKNLKNFEGGWLNWEKNIRGENNN